MLGKRVVVILGFILVVGVMYHPTVTVAHTPGPMTLEYDWNSQVLTVNVVHVVEDPLTHYIYEITIYNGTNLIQTRNYSNQSSTDGFTDTFEIFTFHGDVLSVTAKCNQGGQVTEEIIVTNPAATITTTDTTDTTTQGSSSGPSSQEFITIFVITSIITIIIATFVYCNHKIES